MKYLLKSIVFLLLLSNQALSQEKMIGEMFETKKQIFKTSTADNDKVVIILKQNDSLYFKTKDNVLLGSISYSDIYLPDSVSQEIKTATKKIVSYSGKNYTSEIKSLSKNGMVDNISISIDNREVFIIERGRSFHCNNHSPTVHNCPTSPSIASPPCNSGCRWVAD